MKVYGLFFYDTKQGNLLAMAMNKRDVALMERNWPEYEKVLVQIEFLLNKRKDNN